MKDLQPMIAVFLFLMLGGPPLLAQQAAPFIFEITSPTYYSWTNADVGETTDFGVPISGNVSGQLAWAETGNADPIISQQACTSLQNDLSGKIAVIRRGNCNFSLKIYHAQMAGAIAVIMCNNDPDGQAVFNMNGVDSASAVTIPSIHMTYSACENIIIPMMNQGPVDAAFNLLFSTTQVTLDENNVPLSADFEWERVNITGAAAAAVSVSVTGQDLMLDYSFLEGGNTSTLAHFAPIDTAFLDSDRYYTGQVNLVPGLPLLIRYYEKKDATGYYLSGIHKIPQPFGIGAITGSATDSLIFEGSNSVYAEPRFFLKFPTQYGDEWESNTTNITPYNLTVAAFGLDNAPGSQIQQAHQTNEVVGWGTLRVPTPDGVSIPYDVLVVKQSLTVLTNYTLFGQPAPPAMLAAFGLVDGTEFTNNNYLIYAPGFEVPLMQFAMDENWESAFLVRYTLNGVETDENQPIALDSDNFNVSQTHSWEFVQLSFAGLVPAEGGGADYDFTGITGGNAMTQDYFAPADADFLAETRFYTGLGQYPGGPTVNFYEKLDATGLYSNGYSIQYSPISLAFGTGNVLDSLIYYPTTVHYDEPIYRLKLPASNGKTWTSNNAYSAPFELTVTAFGLNSAPGHQTRTVSQTSSVAGWGTARVPTAAGVSIAYDVILVKEELTYVDNYFLFGQPAPAALLSFFGLVDGQEYKINHYYLYAEGLEDPLISVRMDGVWQNSIYFRYTMNDVEESLYSPIVLTEDNTPRTPLFTWQRVNVQGPNPVPALGAGVHLDYTDLLGGNVITRNYLAPVDAAFSNATRFNTQYPVFVPGLPFEVRYYETVDSSGFSESGFQKTAQNFGIGAVTGNPADSLIFPASSNVYTEPRYLLKFPTKYGDSWVSNTSNYTPFLLTVAAMGLNNAPGMQIQHINQENEVVGWGTVQIPTPQGPSIPYEVLIVKQTQTIATNYTLFGQPAPPAMLAAFGLQEGTFTSRVYEMYSPNFETYLMQFGMDSEWENVNWINYTLTDVKHEYTVAGKAYHYTDFMDGINMVAIESDEDFTYTDEAGIYSLQATHKSDGAAVTASKDGNPLNGISTFDAVLITRHILGVESFDSPYAKIAADINNNGFIEIGDVLQLRRMIIFLDDDFVDPFTGEKNSDSWRFIPANQTVTDNALSSNTVPEYTSTALVGPIHTMGQISQDFIGIKVGDVNGSANPQMLTSSGDNHIALFNRSSTIISVEDVHFEAGDIIEIPLYMNDIKDIKGMQWALNWNPEALNIVEFVPGAIPQLNQSNFNVSTLHTSVFLSWNNEEKILRNNEPFAFVRFETLESGILSESIAVCNDLLRGEAYFSTGEVSRVQLQFTETTVTTNGHWDVYPNPSNGNTMLSFDLPESSDVTISVFDIAGRLIFEYSPGELHAGKQSIHFDAKRFPTTGTYILKFDATDLQFSTRIQILQE